jgi:cyclic-di-AMP phosphodiesterase PgpH
MLRTRVRAGVTAGVLLSAIFGLLFALIQASDTFVPSWAPMLGKVTPITLRVPYGPRITRGSGTDSFAYEHVRVMVPRGTVLQEADDDARA